LEFRALPAIKNRPLQQAVAAFFFFPRLWSKASVRPAKP